MREMLNSHSFSIFIIVIDVPFSQMPGALELRFFAVESAF